VGRRQVAGVEASKPADGRHHEVPHRRQAAREAPESYRDPRQGGEHPTGAAATRAPFSVRQPSDPRAGRTRPGSGEPSHRHPRARDDRGRNLPRRGGLRRLGGRRAGQRRGERHADPVRGPRLRDAGRAGARRRVDPRSRAAPPDAAAARRHDLPHDRDHARAHRRDARSRTRRAGRRRAVARGLRQAPRRHSRRRRVLDLRPPHLPRRGRHPRRLPARRPAPSS
jgi:hypothetical protein